MQLSSVSNRCFFFFQAEDGIRDLIVTGVQTCALPISEHPDIAQSLNNLALLYHHQGKYEQAEPLYQRDRKSTRLNSSHDQISYAVFCLKKKKTNKRATKPDKPIKDLQNSHGCCARHEP